jgi:hypothetical protein
LFGLKVQCGSALAAAHTPKLNGCGVGANDRAWSGLKPSCPVSTTVKAQPGPGWPSAAFGTLNVMNREIAFALIVTVPTPAPPASTNRCPKPCASTRRLHANWGAIW